MKNFIQSTPDLLEKVLNILHLLYRSTKAKAFLKTNILLFTIFATCFFIVFFIKADLHYQSFCDHSRNFA